MSAPRPIARGRATRQRAAILRVIEATRCHMSADAIYRRLRRGSRPIGLATVYRSLETFVRQGLVEPVYVGDGRVRYGLAAKHHDHLVCLGCGEWNSLDDCLMPASRGAVAAGFRITGHRLELYGFCAACQGASM